MSYDRIRQERNEIFQTVEFTNWLLKVLMWNLEQLSWMLQKKYVFFLVPFVLVVLMYILISNLSMPSTLVNLGSAHWCPYVYSQGKDQEWFEKNCLQKPVSKALEDLPDMLEQWKKSSEIECRKLLMKFNKIFKVSFESGKIELPDPFTEKVKKWLGNKDDLFQEAFDQQIVKIYNEYTREENTYNPIRSKRPMSIPKQPEREYIDQLAEKTQKDCDFCRYQDFTAKDVFGRVDNKLSFSASNTFKLDHWHALFMMKQHHPLNWTKEHFMDLMNTTAAWFSKAHKYDNKYKYPSLIWDLLPHGGASQVHPHLHGFLDSDRYQGVEELWRRAAMDYNHDNPDQNLFSDMVQLHQLFGLTVTYGKAVAFANLVPKRENEIVVVSEDMNEDFQSLWYAVIRGYLDEMNKQTLCYSSGVAFPSMSGGKGSNSLPAFLRIVTRGPVADVRSDISSLELFSASNANTDPFQVIEYMKESVKKRLSSR